MLNGIGRDTVISPVSRAGKGGDRHQLDKGDTKFAQVRQALDSSIERAGRREGANVKLVDDGITEFQAAPTGIAPGEAIWIDDLGGAMNSFGQQAGDGVGNGLAAINDVKVAIAGARGQ